jgi:hypothetical protein
MDKNAAQVGQALRALLSAIQKPAKAVGRFAIKPEVAIPAAGLAAAPLGYAAFGKRKNAPSPATAPVAPPPEPSMLDKGITKTKELATSAIDKGKELTNTTINKGKELATGAGNWAKENWKPLAGGAAVGIGSILLYELLRKEKEKERQVV